MNIDGKENNKNNVYFPIAAFPCKTDELMNETEFEETLNQWTNYRTEYNKE